MVLFLSKETPNRQAYPEIFDLGGSNERIRVIIRRHGRDLNFFDQGNDWSQSQKRERQHHRPLLFLRGLTVMIYQERQYSGISVVSGYGAFDETLNLGLRFIHVSAYNE